MGFLTNADVEFAKCKCCGTFTDCRHGWCYGCHGDMRKIDGLIHKRDAELAALRAQNERLTHAAREALEHVTELRDAWMRGALHERDNLGATRSIRNVDVESKLREALSVEQNLGDQT